MSCHGLRLPKVVVEATKCVATIAKVGAFVTEVVPALAASQVVVVTVNIVVVAIADKVGAAVANIVARQPPRL